MDLAQRAGIAAGWQGVDLCCCTGAGMRFLARFLKVARMTGVDATPAVLQLGRRRCADEGLAEKISFVEANACATGLPSGQFDFVWGEDAWCYVEDKAKLIAEAARLIKPQGKIAFTDWMEGPAGLTEAEAAPLSRLHEISQRAHARRIPVAARSQRLLRARRAGHRPLCRLPCRFIST